MRHPLTLSNSSPGSGLPSSGRGVSGASPACPITATAGSWDSVRLQSVDFLFRSRGNPAAGSSFKGLLLLFSGGTASCVCGFVVLPCRWFGNWCKLPVTGRQPDTIARAGKTENTGNRKQKTRSSSATSMIRIFKTWCPRNVSAGGLLPPVD